MAGKSNYKGIKRYPKYTENPFLENAIKDIKIVKKMKVAKASNKAMQVIVNSDGEITGHSQFLQYIEVDEERFTKLYLSQFAAFWELSKPAIRVFGYIMTIMKPGQDRFIFEMDKCLEHTKYVHRNHVISGLSALIECSIIARTKHDWQYYINPLVAFNGDRVTFAKTYVKKKKQPDPNQIPLFNENEDHAEVVMERPDSEEKSGMKMIKDRQLTDEEKDSKNWSNFAGDLKSLNVSEDRITEMIKLVIERMKDEQNGK
jgi:hypothetical protein